MRRTSNGVLAVSVAVLLCFVQQGMAEEGTDKGTATSAASPTTEHLFDATCFDAFFDRVVAAPIQKVTGTAHLGIDEIKYLDAGLDRCSDISPLGFKLGFSLLNQYVWRGQLLGSDTSWQPYVTANTEWLPLGTASFTFWTDQTQHSTAGNTREHDYVADYTVSVLEGLKKMGYDQTTKPLLVNKLADVTVSAGYIYYDFPPHPSTKSQEVYMGFTYNLPLSPSVYVYHDWDRGNGTWYEGKISQTINCGLFKLATYAKLGYNDEQWGMSSKLSTLDMGASIPIPLGKHQTIEPCLSYTKKLHPTYSDAGTELTHDRLYGGINYSIAF